MSPRKFAAKRARIERQGRSDKVTRRAIAHLVREAEGAPIFAKGKVVAYRFADGFTACELRRYRSEKAVIEELEQVQAFAHLHTHRLPVRGFWCQYCRGWHVSARA